jgi:hypothetical protein
MTEATARISAAVRREQPLAGRPGRTSKNVGFGNLGADRDPGQAVRHEVDPQDLPRQQRERHAEERADEHDEQLGESSGKAVADEPADVVEDAPALRDSRHEGPQAVIGEDDVGGFLGHLGAPPAHRHTDIGGSQGGRVVHTVAGHRDDVAGVLPVGDDVELPVRGGARVHGAQAAPEVVRGVGVSEHSGGSRDRRGRAEVVPGDHDRADARPARGENGLPGVGPCRIGEREEPEQTGRSGRSGGHREDAAPLRGPTLRDSLGIRIRSGALQQDLRGALGDLQLAAVNGMPGGHRPAQGVERHDTGAGDPMTQGADIDAARSCRTGQRAFGPTGSRLGVVAQCCGLEQRAGTGSVRHPRTDHEDSAAHGQLATLRRPQRHPRGAARREGAGLVGGKDGHRSQRLHGG